MKALTLVLVLFVSSGCTVLRVTPQSILLLELARSSCAEVHGDALSYETKTASTNFTLLGLNLTAAVVALVGIVPWVGSPAETEPEVYGCEKTEVP